MDTIWLRWATLEGELLPTAVEIAQQEHQRAEQMQSQLQQTVRNLLQTGMATEQVAKLTGVDISQVEELGDR